MNCSALERDLILAGAGCTDAVVLDRIREHLRDCPACAARFQEAAQMAACHRETAEEIGIVPRGAARRAIAVTLPTAAKNGEGMGVVWKWAWALGAAAVLAFGLVRMTPPEARRAVRAPSATVVSDVSMPAVASLRSYRKAMEEASGGELDALLARDADRLLRPVSRDEMRRLLAEAF